MPIDEIRFPVQHSVLLPFPIAAAGTSLDPPRASRLQQFCRRARPLSSWIRLVLLLGVCAALAPAGLINSSAVDTSLFDLTPFASGLAFPAGVQTLGNGSIVVETSPGYGSTPGQLLAFSSTGAGGGTVYTSSTNGLLTGSAVVGNYYAVGADTSVIGPGLGSTIQLLKPGATASAPASLVATIQLGYPSPWQHPSVGLAAEPTPGVPGSYNLVINVGSQYDNVATPSTATVALSGTGFASIPATSLQGDSLYMLTISETGAQPAVTSVRQVATGVRNVFGMTFDSSGNLWFADNGMDFLPPGSTQPVPPSGEPPQADELNVLSAAQLASGSPPNYGFPTCYIQYAWGSIPGVPVGSGCTQPVMAFQPVTDGTGVHQLIGATQVALAPASFPAGFNDGIFVGFTGDGGPNNNGGMAYYSFATNQYTQFIESTNVDNIIGLSSTADALYFTDAGTGTVYELTSSAPEPGTALTAALGLAFAFWRMRRRA